LAHHSYQGANDEAKERMIYNYVLSLILITLK